MFVLSGAGPLIAMTPFVYLLMISGEMQLADLTNFSFLGLLFVAENMINVLESSDEFGSQVLHLAGHIGISYFIHDLNRRHIFNTKDKLT